jgi:hypothetical protein
MVFNDGTSTHTMNRFASLFVALSCAFNLFFAPFAAAQISSPILTEAQAQQDVRVALRALRELHPALTKYQTTAESDTAFARFEARGNAAKTPIEMYLAVAELAASIRCGHTWANTSNQGGAVRAALFDAKNKLPLLMTLVESRFLVLASADVRVKAGDEIVSINGKTVSEIVSMMMPYLRADGSSDGKRLYQLNHDRFDRSMMDVVWPLISPPTDGVYALGVRDATGRESLLRLAAMTFSERSAALKSQGTIEQSSASNEAKQWTLKIDNNVATMTLPTFSFWQTKFDYNAWLSEAFARLARENITHLIIDIRANEGGDGAINRALLSYLLKTPFTWPEYRPIVAYERVPYILAKHLDTWNYDFFDRTGNVEKIGEKQFVFLPRANVDRTIKPVEKPFAGKTYLLVSPENSSATFHLAWLAKLSGAATLVGERTGGNVRGLNATELTWVTLPHSGASFDIPLISQLPVVPQPDASVTPDTVVTPTFAARRAGRDEAMEAALRLVRAPR